MLKVDASVLLWLHGKPAHLANLAKLEKLHISYEECIIDINTHYSIAHFHQVLTSIASNPKKLCLSKLSSSYLLFSTLIDT